MVEPGERMHEALDPASTGRLMLWMDRALRICPTMRRGVPVGANQRETPGGVTVGA
ncbi:hypothetical protein [Sphingomonas sp.]|jgi:hypothetical protein|uniref:hypothetical protein n=1 Tax=Sphingomonas sp. TaxID=28214 RepID=UPI0026349E3D|nr:hypothetical protein [Sphingomonas sp.]